MKPRTRIRPISEKRLKKNGGKMPFSTISAPKKAVRKVNPVAKAKRVKGYRKMLAGKEYKVARAEAFERAGNQCEHERADDVFGSRFLIRCGATEGLHAHHLRYPKSRPLEARDLKILCIPHHRQAEKQKMHKWNKRGFA